MTKATKKPLTEKQGIDCLIDQTIASFGLAYFEDDIRRDVARALVKAGMAMRVKEK